MRAAALRHWGPPLHIRWRNGAQALARSILGSIALTTSPGSMSPYNVSKAAENMYTKELAEDLRSENFTILAIHPGWVQTDM